MKQYPTSQIVGGGVTGFDAARNANAPAEVRKSTEMETLSRRLNNNLGRLRDMNNVLGLRIDNFMPEPSPLAQGHSAAPPTEPQMGTAAHLSRTTQNLDDELSRLDCLLVRLQAII